MKTSFIRRLAMSIAVLVMIAALSACKRGDTAKGGGDEGSEGSSSARSTGLADPGQSKPGDDPATQRPTETPAGEQAKDLDARAKALAQRFIIVDGHIDLPYRLHGVKKRSGKIDYAAVIAGSKEGDFDVPRSLAGGLDAPFMSIYVPASFQETGGAKKVADGLIDMVEALAAAAPDKLAIARTVDEVRTHKAAGKIALPMGIENGAAIEGDLANLTHFYDRGVRYITLTHSKDNDICDSSYDKTRTWKGLSPLGKKVVAEMNRLGIMIDVAHISDDTFHQVMDLTRTPVIASHSSARHFLPGFERNMSDAMIEKLAKNGGVIMINFGSTFISQKSREVGDKRWAAARKFAEENKVEFGDPKLKKFMDDLTAKEPFPYANISEVADHIEHVVELVGIDHVGFGSDFDGVGDTLPTGLKDASMYPALIRALLERGYSDEDIEKICSGNVFRVWRAVEEYAAKQG